MKKLLLFVCGIAAVSSLYLTLASNRKTAGADVEDPLFTSRWAKVDSLERDGLYRQAMTEVGLIFNEAAEAELHNQVIKAVFYDLKYNQYLTEDDYVIGIAKLDKLVKQAPSPSKEILHSVIAQVYWGYYSSNTWKFQNRTTVVEVNLEDIRTWDLKKIAEKVRLHYLLSLQNPQILQSAKIQDFTEIVTYTGYTDEFRPTIYDLLAHRALDFFKYNSFNVPGPAETFSMEEAHYLAGNSTFLSLKPATTDSFNTAYFSFRILQDLTRFHLDENKTEALFQVELERLKFMRDKMFNTDKENLYYTALQRMTNSYQSNKIVAEAWYEIAVVHSQKGGTYSHVGDTTGRWELKTAVDICTKTVDKFKDSYGAQQCAALMSGILQKDMTIRAEQAIPSATKAKFLLEYKNVDTLYMKIAPYDYKKIEDGDYKWDKFVKELRNIKPIHSAAIPVTNPGDYQRHSTEAALPELAPGFYYIIVGSDKNFADGKTAFSFAPLWVTDLTYQSRKIANVQHVVVSDRTNGKPVAGVKATVWYHKYNYNTYRDEKKTLGTYTSDVNGKFTFEGAADYATYMISLSHNGHVYSPSDGIYSYNYYDYNSNSYNQTTLFTDRTIYRPGQTIYFKGIMLNFLGEERSLRTNTATTVYFYDVNGEEIGKQDVTSNEFGSFQGKFTAPYGVLTGQMRIQESYGSRYFRVEEYKRPKFYVEMNPVEGEFKVNDLIKTTGKAQAYAGNRIDGANVKYRVVRSTYYSNWWYWWWRPNHEPKEVSSGEVKSDENGEFKIDFTAIPDKSADAENLPVFSYTVYVDVTDINGEIHSTSTTVSVGYQSLKLGHNFSEDMNNEEDFFLRLSTTNLNGQKIAAKGNIRIAKLNTPDQPFYPVYWERPDMQRWSKSEFKSNFPNEPFKNEDDYRTWTEEKTVFKYDFNTEKTDSVDLKNYKTWSPGVYVYEASANDKNGVEVKDKFYFTIYAPKSTTAPNNQVLWIKPLQFTAEPGENAEFLIATAEKDLQVRYDIEVKNKIVSSQVITLSQEQRKISIPVKEEHRGNITVQLTAIRKNRNFSGTVSVVVPYTNKELDLEFSTFRDKLLPGSAEEWSLTIKNRKGEKETAELLATLYDASLDALYSPNSFYMSIYNSYYGYSAWSYPVGMTQAYAQNVHYWNDYVYYPSRYWAYLNQFGWNNYYYGGYRYYGGYDGDGANYEGAAMGISSHSGKKDGGGRVLSAMSADEAEISDISAISEEKSMAGEMANDRDKNNEQTLLPGGNANPPAPPPADGDMSGVQARSNFNETAFFYPQLTTDEKGSVKISFTIPESLTKWKFIGLAHTKDLKIGTITKDIITQKDLMVVPNMPRFFREGDQIVLTSKISNVSKEDMKGKVQISLIDPFTDKPIDDLFKLSGAMVDFEAGAGKSTSASWKLTVPYNMPAVKVKIVAKAGNFSDGEENVLPILSNRMLVTESMPMPIRGNQTKNFTFTKLKNSGQSSTLRHYAYTVEFTSNPAWYALQAMPYIMEYPYECAEQTFARYYSNAIASHVMNSNPKIKKVIEDWGQNSPEAFMSNLQKNQELKSLILEETPWVLDAKNEEQSKKNLAVLLDLERMSRELDQALSKTIKSQSPNGGWPWFPGMRESRYITQHIVTGMGHLDHLGIKDVRENRKVWQMVKNGVEYLDRQIRLDYEYAKRYDPDYLVNQHIGYDQVQYLYARSYFPEIDMSNDTKEAVGYYKDQAIKFWLTFNIYAEGMLALAAHRFAMPEFAVKIVKSLKDRSIQHEEFGMYWKDYYTGYYWWEAPVETQAMMIEMFDEVTNDLETVEELKIWLLKEKQTTNWKTTKQTSEAIYALLLKGSDLLISDELVEVNIGGKNIEYTANPVKDNPYQVKTQAGTGYFKTRWNEDAVKPEMGDIKITKKDKGIAWGAAYWQYFEDLDKITFAETNLKLQKDLFLVEVTPQGEVLKPVGDNHTLHVGDKVKVRIELRTDRNLEYVHMKDMRASGFEPMNVLSRYYYQDGLGYYQSTKDAATNFFFDYVPKGTYVFEYGMWVQHKGDFSNGITTIQCMYAPEFTSHSDGIRVKVE